MDEAGGAAGLSKTLDVQGGMRQIEQQRHERAARQQAIPGRPSTLASNQREPSRRALPPKAAAPVVQQPAPAPAAQARAAEAEKLESSPVAAEERVASARSGQEDGSAVQLPLSAPGAAPVAAAEEETPTESVAVAAPAPAQHDANAEIAASDGELEAKMVAGRAEAEAEEAAAARKKAAAAAAAAEEEEAKAKAKAAEAEAQLLAANAEREASTSFAQRILQEQAELDAQHERELAERQGAQEMQRQQAAAAAAAPAVCLGDAFPCRRGPF
jgi:colicin import membrane protein